MVLYARAEDEPPLVVAGCKNGEASVVNGHGKPRAVFDCRALLRDLISVDIDGEGRHEVIAVTSAPSRLWILAPP